MSFRFNAFAFKPLASASALVPLLLLLIIMMPSYGINSAITEATPQAVALPVAAADADNVSLQSILKPEQQKAPSEAYAVGGIDTPLAERTTSPPAASSGNLWQVVFALLGVSAGAWWVLNTAWFKQLAQQKEAQWLQKNGGNGSHAPAYGGVTQPPAPVLKSLNKGIAWVASLLNNSSQNPVEPTELALASVLQTLPLAGGQYLVMVKIGDSIQSMVTGGQQPLLTGTWNAELLLSLTQAETPEKAHQAEKWMAQTPPTPTPSVRTEDRLVQNETLLDYEALNESEEALFGQLLQAEKRVF
jgi:hypothetical protein